MFYFTYFPFIPRKLLLPAFAYYFEIFNVLPAAFVWTALRERHSWITWHRTEVEWGCSKFNCSLWNYCQVFISPTTSSTDPYASIHIKVIHSLW